MEEFRDRPRAPDTPESRTDKAADRAADRADRLAIGFADGSRVRRADLEIKPGDTPPPDAADRRAAYLAEYRKQLAHADTHEVQLPNELASLRDTVTKDSIADKVRAIRDRLKEIRAPDETDETALRIHRPESNDPYDPGQEPNEYRDDALDGPDGERIPLFDGPPRREDIEQGQLDDCGVITGVGAVAGTAPDKIRDAITQNEDGTYSVRLYEVKSSYPDGMSETTGRRFTYTVTPDLPVGVESETPLGASVGRVAWPAVMEKAIAGSDQTWTPEQKAAYEERWAGQKHAMDEERKQAGEEPLPDGPVPSGYNRLNQGSNMFDQADLLTAITGRQAEVRLIPKDDKELIKSFFADKLAYDKPILVGTRPYDSDAKEVMFPHGLQDAHAYEVTGLTRDGRIELRNPWNEEHPEPLTPDQFREYFLLKRPDGSRVGGYATLT